LTPLRHLRGTPAAALSTLAAFAILTIVLAGQSIAACSKQMSVDMPGMGNSGTGMASMPGMDIPPTSGTLMICPVVLLLAILSAALMILTLMKVLCDPHRAVAGRRLVHAVSAFPITPISTLVAFGGATGIGLMLAVDGNAPQSLAGWLSLAGIVVATAVGLTLAAVAL
jgi:hypothetical protein